MCRESPGSFADVVVGFAENRYRVLPNSPSTVQVRVLSFPIAVHTEVSLKITEGVSAFLPSFPRAMRNFVLRSTFVKR